MGRASSRRRPLQSPTQDLWGAGRPWSLASQTTASVNSDDAVAALAARLASGPSLALSQTKSLLTREPDMSLSSSMELDAMTQALLMTTDDHAEFHAAFNAGRPPAWKGQ